MRTKKNPPRYLKLGKIVMVGRVGWKGLPNRHLFSHMEVNVIQTSKLIYLMRIEKMKGK